jgi:hypothetical protein
VVGYQFLHRLPVELDHLVSDLQAAYGRRLTACWLPPICLYF